MSENAWDATPVLQGELVTPDRERYRLHRTLALEVRAGYLARYSNKNTRVSNATAVDQWYRWCDEQGIDPNPPLGGTVIYYGYASEAPNRGRVLGSTVATERERLSAMAGIRGQGRLRQDVLAGVRPHGAPGGVPSHKRLGAPRAAGHHSAHLRRAAVLRAHAPQGRHPSGERQGPGCTRPSEPAEVVDAPRSEAHARPGARDPQPARRGGVVPDARPRLRHAPAEHRPHLPTRGLPRRDLTGGAR